MPLEQLSSFQNITSAPRERVLLLCSKGHSFVLSSQYHFHSNLRFVTVHATTGLPAWKVLMTVRVSKKNRATTGLRHASRTAGIFVASSLLAGVTQVHAQDVAEAARQARNRKENAQKKNKHVYTEQDLQRSEILTPEDRAEVEAKKHSEPAQPGVLPQESFDADLLLPQMPLAPGATEPSVVARASSDQHATTSAHDADFSDVHVSLGEVARAYRKQKELAAQSKNFHLPFSEQPVLAAPKPLPMLVASPKKPASPEQFQLRKPVSAPTEKARAFKPTLRSPFGRPGVPLPANLEITANQATPAAPSSAPAAEAHNFGNSRVAPNLPGRVVAAPAAPALKAPKTSMMPGTFAAPATVARPRATIRLTETPSPIVHAQTPAIPAAPKLQTAPTSQAAPLLAPAAVAKPAPVLHLNGSATPVLPNHKAVAPAAPKLSAPQIAAVSSELIAPAAPTTPATEFVAPSPVQRTTNSRKSVVVAPILNLVAPKTVPANPGAIAPPKAANSGTAIIPSVVVPASGTRGLATITVQVGDSLWTLAQKNLGNGSRWHELVAVNPAISNPNRILAGTTLALPAGDIPAVKSNVPTTKHVVVKGDTLWAIAQSRLGNALYWSCIAQANPTLKDPNRIYAMQEIFIPASCKE